MNKKDLFLYRNKLIVLYDKYTKELNKLDKEYIQLGHINKHRERLNIQIELILLKLKSLRKKIRRLIC